MNMNIGAMNINTGYPGGPRVPLVGDRGDLVPHMHSNHSVQFYEDDAFLLDELSRFIGSALGAGDAAVVIATRAHREKLARGLKALGLDIALATRQGRYVSLDAAQTLSKFMLDGRPDAARFTELVGGVVQHAAVAAKGERPRVAAFGEMVALLWEEGKLEAAIKLEQLWNDLAQTHSFELRCGYPMNYFSGAGDSKHVGEICAEHSHVVPAESYTTLANDGERHRAIALLQQKAQALETELEERKKVQEALQRAVAARDEFLSVAAHELKTPLTSLRCYAQLLLRDVDEKREIAPERLESALRVIDVQTQKLSHLMVRLLDTAQIEAGKLRIERCRTDLVALVGSTLTQQQGRANHKLVFDSPEHVEAMVDPIRFEQVITNLLDNAVKFSPDGGVVTVGLGQDDEGSIRLSVTDHGVGIPSDQREAIFERFHQAHGKHHLSGMGLGLYITREIVESHGGTIEIEGPEHGGARFVVILPPLTSSANDAQTYPAV